TFLVSSWMPFCLQNCFNPWWHRFNKVLDTFLREFEIINCPIKLFFTIDTSETIALQESPPGSLVESIKDFTRMFAQQLATEKYMGQIQIIWSIGGLHFSQTQVTFSDITTRENFIRNLVRIKYLGKGTYIDCALKNMTYQMTHYLAKKDAVLFAVIITDGHVTGSPCGGIKMMADKARDQGIHVFSVAASRNIDEIGMREIAGSPTELIQHNPGYPGPRGNPGRRGPRVRRTNICRSFLQKPEFLY
uniref:VWFA domain-containing protein n=1 Tax=Oryzias latipes TaxID=8090 RepID=A0A3P9JXB2_ORYLA